MTGPTIVVLALALGGCETVLGLDPIPAPADAGSFACPSGSDVLLCGDFESTATGVGGLFSSSSGSGGDVANDLANDAPGGQHVLAATAGDGDFALASAQLPTRIVGVPAMVQAQLDVDTSVFQTCGTTFAYLDFQRSGSDIPYRAFLSETDQTLVLHVVTPTTSPTVVHPITWSGSWQHVVLTVTPTVVRVDVGAEHVEADGLTFAPGIDLLPYVKLGNVYPSAPCQQRLDDAVVTSP